MTTIDVFLRCNYALWVHCRTQGCGRSARFGQDDIARLRRPQDIDLDDIIRRIRCTGCRAGNPECKITWELPKGESTGPL